MHVRTWILSQAANGFVSAFANCWILRPTIPSKKSGQRYFFRKRLPGQEQPCIYLREGPDGEDCLLIDPAERCGGKHTAVKPLRVSLDGQILLYEVKEGGERTGTFELLDIQNRKTLPDVLSRGYLRGFAFAPDSRSFYYVHEAITPKPQRRAVYHHVLGTRFDDDKQILFAGDADKLRLSIVPGKEWLGFLVYRFLDKPYTDFYLWRFGSGTAPTLLIENAGYKFGPLLMKDGRILAVTDRDAPNSRIVKLRLREGLEPEFVDVIPATDASNPELGGDRKSNLCFLHSRNQNPNRRFRSLWQTSRRIADRRVRIRFVLPVAPSKKMSCSSNESRSQNPFKLIAIRPGLARRSSGRTAGFRLTPKVSAIHRSGSRQETVLVFLCSLSGAVMFSKVDSIPRS